MVRDTASQMFMKRAFASGKVAPEKVNSNTGAEANSLMFAGEPKESDMLSEFLELQKGVIYPAKGPDHSCKVVRKFLSESIYWAYTCAKTNRSQFAEFEIESVVKYSYNRGKKTFTFSHMDADGLLSEYKLVSDKYFEIFDALGRAIAIVIKIKNRNLVPHKSVTQVESVSPPESHSREISTADSSVKAYGSLSNLVGAEPNDQERGGSSDALSMPDSSRKKKTGSQSPIEVSGLEKVARKGLSEENLASSVRIKSKTARSGFDKLLGSKRSFDQLAQNHSTSLTNLSGGDGGKSAPGNEGSRSTQTKVALAKFYMEARYRNAGGDKPASLERMGSGDLRGDPPTQQERKWKSQKRIDYVRSGTLQKRMASEPLLSEVEPTSDKRSTGSISKSSDFLSVGSASLSSKPHSKSYSEPLAPATHKPAGSARNSVMALFGSAGTSGAGGGGGGGTALRTDGAGSVRVRAASENVTGDEKYRTVSGKSLHFSPHGSSEKLADEKLYDLYGTISGWKKMAGNLTVRRAKRSSVSPVKDLDSSSVHPDSTRLPAVLKTYDSSGKEILIKNLREGGYEITAGSADALVEALVDESDLAYVDTFLLTFRHVIKPPDLLSKLVRQYETQSELVATGENRASSIMHRVVSFVKKWVGEHFYDFLEPETMSALRHFLDVLSRGEYASYAEQIHSLIKYETAQLDEGESDAPSNAHDLDAEELKNRLCGFDILAQSSKKIARQLTLTDSKLFRAIRAEEFAMFIWSEPGEEKTRRTRNLQAYISRFNQIGYWVATLICSYDDLKRRVDVMEKLIKIGVRCVEYQNFNGAMAILSGLNTTPVLRLKRTFAGISSRIMTFYEDLEAKLSYRGNYKVYREIEHEAKPPFIPFFGLIIKDLTFMNDGNQKILSNGLINFEKLRMIFNVINTIRSFQRQKFPFLPDDTPRGGFIPRSPSSISVGTQQTTESKPLTLAAYCACPPKLPEDQLVMLSKMIEPPRSEAEKSAGPAPSAPPTRKGSIFGSIVGSGGSSDTSQVSPAILDMISSGTIGKKKGAADKRKGLDSGDEGGENGGTIGRGEGKLGAKTRSALLRVESALEESGDEDTASTQSRSVMTTPGSSRPASVVMASLPEAAGEASGNGKGVDPAWEVGRDNKDSPDRLGIAGVEDVSGGAASVHTVLDAGDAPRTLLLGDGGGSGSDIIGPTPHESAGLDAPEAERAPPRSHGLHSRTVPEYLPPLSPTDGAGPPVGTDDWDSVPGKGLWAGNSDPNLSVLGREEGEDGADMILGTSPVRRH
ncbi:hypothetical protein HK104_002494 [Borealophlyctis nickersoniae]|nr:hypothetical protein HK104_002494 [Borealophlyctis nickersoniae]